MGHCPLTGSDAGLSECVIIGLVHISISTVSGPACWSAGGNCPMIYRFPVPPDNRVVIHCLDDLSSLAQMIGLTLHRLHTRRPMTGQA